MGTRGSWAQGRTCSEPPGWGRRGGRSGAGQAHRLREDKHDTPVNPPAPAGPARRGLPTPSPARPPARSASAGASVRLLGSSARPASSAAQRRARAPGSLIRWGTSSPPRLQIPRPSPLSHLSPLRWPGSPPDPLPFLGQTDGLQVRDRVSGPSALRGSGSGPDP